MSSQHVPVPSAMRRALAAVEAGLAFAEEERVKVAIVVLDRSYTPLAAVRMDDAYESTFKVALAKAHTALNFRARTDAVRERVKPENQAALRNVERQLCFVGGGHPLVENGRIVGAVGVSGASETQDTECSRLVAERFGT